MVGWCRCTAQVGVQDDGFPILSVDKPGWWWVVHTCNDIYKLEPPVKEDTVKELMKSIGFGYPGGPDRAANLELPVTSYSGGWKMKMQLCAAQLMNADVLMLDEPTGHLDVDNIKWLEDWLESFDGSIICTSHFSPFLDKMCTHIIDFQERPQNLGELETHDPTPNAHVSRHFWEGLGSGRGSPPPTAAPKADHLPSVEPS
eukprot:Skav205651  [mRNA]  locus=scaffold458:165429:166809:+ [translate_table: standard]